MNQQTRDTLTKLRNRLQHNYKLNLAIGERLAQQDDIAAAKHAGRLDGLADGILELDRELNENLEGNCNVCRFIYKVYDLTFTYNDVMDHSGYICDSCINECQAWESKRIKDPGFAENKTRATE